jgi:hypothetical protein
MMNADRRLSGNLFGGDISSIRMKRPSTASSYVQSAARAGALNTIRVVQEFEAACPSIFFRKLNGLMSVHTSLM